MIPLTHVKLLLPPQALRHLPVQPHRGRHRQVAPTPPGARGAEGEEPQRVLHLRLRVPLPADDQQQQQQLQPKGLRGEQPVILRHPEKLPIGSRINDLVQVPSFGQSDLEYCKTNAAL